MIPPGKAGTIRATMKSGSHRGALSKPVTVTTNDPAQANVGLTIQAQVQGSVVVLPTAALSFATFADRPRRLLVRKDPTETGTLAVAAASATLDWIAVTADGNCAYRYNANSDLVQGNFGTPGPGNAAGILTVQDCAGYEVATAVINPPKTQNLGFFLSILPRPAEKGALERWVEAFGIGPFMNRRFDSLSTGERQKVALVRAFAMDALLYLLDEPFRSLDDAGLARLGEILKEFRGSKTVLIASPQEHPLLSACTRTEALA